MALDAVQREEWIQQYADGPSKLRDALQRTPESAQKWRPGPGKWSVHEIICHCADSETNAALRIRSLLAEKDPVLVGYDQDEWARRLDYHQHPLEPALATVEAVRANTAVLLRRLQDSDWAKVGRHTESGRYSAETWLEIYANHLDQHVRQIDRNLAAWRAAQSSAK